MAALIGQYVMGRPVIHTDDTTIKVLAPGHGKTRTGRFWVYAADPRIRAGSGPPAAFYRYSPDRDGERPRTHLSAFSGFLYMPMPTPVTVRSTGLRRGALRPRGASEPELLPVDVVVNCTGSGHRSVTDQHPVLRGLASAGLLQADPARLGILVDGESRVVRGAGGAWPNLFVAGPLARGTHGELMGLPQVNLQPRAVAASVASLAEGSAVLVPELLA